MLDPVAELIRIEVKLAEMTRDLQDRMLAAPGPDAPKHPDARLLHGIEGSPFPEAHEAHKAKGIETFSADGTTCTAANFTPAASIGWQIPHRRQPRRLPDPLNHTPAQAAVLYSADTLLGGGWIERATDDRQTGL